MDEHNASSEDQIQWEWKYFCIEEYRLCVSDLVYDQGNAISYSYWGLSTKPKKFTSVED